jgi:hypothetical protein
LEAETEVQPTSLPRFLEITARPMIDGVLGVPLAAGRIPLMLLAPEEDGTAESAPKDKVALAK